jgi:hypothetical protein
LYDRHCCSVHSLALFVTDTAEEADRLTLLVFLGLWRSPVAGDELAALLRGVLRESGHALGRPAARSAGQAAAGLIPGTAA